MSNDLSQSATDATQRRIRRMQFFPTTDNLPEPQTVSMPGAKGNGNGTAHKQELRRSPLTGQKQREKKPPVPSGRSSQRPTVETEPARRLPIEIRDKSWKPGTFGFDDAHDSFELKKEDTFPMMVLKGISKQQGQETPVMQSEISGAASSASIVGVGTIAGNFFRYGNNLLIQRGFGPSGFGLYTLGMSMVNLVSSIFNLGLDDAMVRYVAIYRGKKQPHLLRGVTIFAPPWLP